MHNYFFAPAPSSTPWAPAWSPDGATIAIAMSGSIWAVTPSTGAARELTYTEFTQQDPVEGAPASERTEVRLIVGRGHIYVGIICFDSDPAKIIVSQARRDASLNETDSVIMVLDTFNDNQNAFVFGTNPGCRRPACRSIFSAADG